MLRKLLLLGNDNDRPMNPDSPPTKQSGTITVVISKNAVNLKSKGGGKYLSIEDISLKPLSISPQDKKILPFRV